MAESTRITHTVDRGEDELKSELRRRGANHWTEIQVGRVRLLALQAPERIVHIRVKTRSKGEWQASTRDGAPRTPPLPDATIWVFVDLTTTPARFYLLPDEEVRQNIDVAHQAYLSLHGGRRAENDTSEHHAIALERIEHGRDRWDLLGDVFTTNAAPPAWTNSIFPTELKPGERYDEGTVKQVLVNAYERDPRARAACLKHYGCRCAVCDLSFEERYGSLGKAFIHVHHKKPLASVGAGYTVDPLRDLVPVCPNCHAMLHRTPTPLTTDELRERIRVTRGD
jgi:hypothetical protein